jgi:ribosomal protein S8
MSLGYILSDHEIKSIVNYEIKSFDILSDNLIKHITIIKNNNIVCRGNILNYASEKGYICILDWFKKSGYLCLYDYYTLSHIFDKKRIKVLKWFKLNIGLKGWHYAFLRKKK